MKEENIFDESVVSDTEETYCDESQKDVRELLDENLGEESTQSFDEDIDQIEECSNENDEDHITKNTQYLNEIRDALDNITDSEHRIFTEVREMHKLYHNEFAGRLRAMQDELEQYRKIDKGRAFDDILSSIARIYCNNETLADEVSDSKAKKDIKYMLMDIEDLLNVYGMEKLHSVSGEKRNPRHCQVINRIVTDDPAKHDTIAKSYNSGFYIGNRTIIKEKVDVYIYEKQTPIDESNENSTVESGYIPVTE